MINEKLYTCDPKRETLRAFTKKIKEGRYRGQ